MNAFPDKSTALILYCGGGFRSALSADNLQKMGYTNVFSMAGGWRARGEANAFVESLHQTQQFMKILSIFFAVVAFCTLSFGQSASKTVSRMKKALGNEKAFKSGVPRVVRGEIKRLSDGVTGKYEAYFSAGNLFLEKFDLGGFEYSAAFNGKSAWQRDSRDGARTLTGNASRDLQAESVYRNTRWTNAKSEKSKIFLAGAETVSGKPVDILTLTSSKGATVKIFTDKSDGRVIREILPAGDSLKTLDYSEFKNFNGANLATKIKYSYNGEEFEISVLSVEFNAKFDNSVFEFPRNANEPLPNIDALLKGVRENATKLEGELENYSYEETAIERGFDDKGNLIDKSSETTFLTFYKGNRIRRLIAKDGKSLSESDQRDEDRRAEKTVREIEEKQQKQALKEGVGGTPKDEGKRITLSDALRGSLLVNPRRERFANRDVVVFDYVPNPSYKPEKRIDKLFALSRGTVWVDENDKQVTRLEAYLTESAGNLIGKVKRGAAFTLEYEHVNNEIWLPKFADINFQVKILFASINFNTFLKYGNYAKFKTETKDAKVGTEVQ